MARVMTDHPQWLQDAFSLAHPMALDPDGWRQAKAVEAAQLASLREQSLHAGPAIAVLWALAERLSSLPDLFVYGRYAGVGYTPCVEIDAAKVVMRQPGMFAPREWAEVGVTLTYLVRSAYRHLASDVLALDGPILRTLLDDQMDDDLSRLVSSATIGHEIQITESRRYGRAEYLTVEFPYTAHLKQE